jgi:hypothetical protein
MNITKQQKREINLRLSRKTSSYKNREFFTLINSKEELTVLCKYETEIGLIVFDRIFPDGTSNHGGCWPATPTDETIPEMVKVLKKNLKNKFGKNLPIVLDITH